MVNQKLSDDEILKLMTEGWTPRRKAVGNRDYVYLRRGSQEKEISLGRMRPELSWLFEDKTITTSPTAVPATRKAA